MKNHINNIITVFLLAAVGLIFSGTAFAQDVTLSWNPSGSDGVVGYKLYYKADSTEVPLDGIEALEGPSPIDVGNTTTFTLTELPEGSVYYFRATAYDSQGNESTFSNLVASAWIPAPLAPVEGGSAGSTATLVWSAPPDDLDLTFTVVYGTDPKLPKSSAIVAGGKTDRNLPTQPDTMPLLAALLCLAGLSLPHLAKRFGKRRLVAATICLGMALSATGCGGGGGGGGDDSSSSSASVSQSDDTVVVAGLTDSYYTTGELDSGSTYYWQVIATDSDGQEYQSEVSSFVAE